MAIASILIVVAALSAVTLAHVIARPIEPNEHMYVAASVLAMDHTLYEEFAFVQMPYLPRHYAFLYSLFGSEHYLLHARMACWIAFMVMTLCVGGIAWHYSRDPIIVITGMIAFVWCDSIILITGECSNYTLAACVSLMAFWAFVSGRARPGTDRRPGTDGWGGHWGKAAAALVGLLIGISVCIKLYYAVLVPVFVLASWFRPSAVAAGVGAPGRRDRVWETAMLIGGVALGVFPAFMQLASAPDAFMFNNLGFHRWKTQVYLDTGYGDRMSLHSRIQLGKTCLQHASQMWVFYVGILAAGVLYRHWRRIGDCFELAVACCLTLTCLSAAIIPVPAWQQYFAMPIPFAMVIALMLASRYKKIGRPLMCAVALTGMFVAGPYYGRAVAKSLHADGRTGSVLHAESRALIAKIGKPRPLVAGTRTLIPIEGGGRIYPEFALSGFMFELSRHLPEDQIRRYCVTAPQALEDLFRASAPDAIITREMEVDRPLIEYARARGYREIKNRVLDVSLWLPESSLPEN